MSNDEKTFEEEIPEADADVEASDDDPTEDLFDDEAVDDDAILTDDDDDEAVSESDGTAIDASEDGEETTEALDDLEAEELEMLTEDEASETIVVDEATQLRDIRRAQLAMESGLPGGIGDGEFVCSSCFLVKRSSQLSSRRKKICTDCAG